ncbi:MAG: TonB-dependent receptor [Rhodothermaceae bacterium]|nr:TonB-dependent receptor [Rhodothermaceae bacterium]
MPTDLEAITNPEDGIRLDTDFEASATSSQLSPRIGLAFPIAESGVLHVSYGHFFQIPRFSYIFANSEFEVRLGDLETMMGNANLKPERTIAYEVGVQQAVAADWKFELTVYYKDIKNLLGQEIITTRDKKIYARYINRDYGNTRGIVFSLIRQYRGSLGATVDYTYQIARGNASDPNAVFFDHQASPPRESEKQILPLDWDQRHALNGTLIVGNPGSWTLSFIGRFHTGQPYTPTDPGSALAEQFENSERKPSQVSLDVNFNRSLQWRAMRVKLFGRVYNALDRLNADRVYSSTGNPAHPYRTVGESEILAQNPNFTVDEINLRPDFYSQPRRIVAGVELSF